MAVEQSTTEVPELPNTCGGVQKGVLHLDVECGPPQNSIALPHLHLQKREPSIDPMLNIMRFLERLSFG